MHAGRFLKFARRHFGPLSHDGPMETAALSNVAKAVSAASGCLWFAGSDDIRADWSVSASGSSNQPRLHVLRCGSNWISDAADGDGIGERRVELAIALQDGLQAAFIVQLRKELDECLLTRDEAACMESDDFSPMLSAQEWEAMRLQHDSLSPWADRMYYVLGLVYFFVSFLQALPMFETIASFGRSCAHRFETSCQAMLDRRQAEAPDNTASSRMITCAANIDMDLDWVGFPNTWGGFKSY